MPAGQPFRHRVTGETGRVIGRSRLTGKMRCRMDNGERRWIEPSDCVRVPREQPSVKEFTLAEASKVTGRPPDDLLHAARMNGLTLRQVVEALTD